MARPIWTGSLTFGLVNAPVRLYRATEDKTIRFHQLQRGTSDRIRYHRVNGRTGKEVDHSDIVKGYPLGDDEYVVVEREELEAVAPGRSRTIDVAGFVDLDEVDPIYFQTTYYLAPQAAEHSRTYALLLRAMREANRAAVATLVMREKQHLALVRPDDDVLALETMFFADEIRDPKTQLANLPDDVSVRKAELDQALQLIDAMAVPWRPEEYRDTYRERVEELIESKRKGEEIAVSEGPGAATNVVDLMDALQRSVQSAQERRSGGGGRSRTDRDEEGRTRRKRRRDGSRQAAKDNDRDENASTLAELTKSQLYDKAGELGVNGRSRMNRDELERAVAAAGRSPRKAS